MSVIITVRKPPYWRSSFFKCRYFQPNLITSIAGTGSNLNAMTEEITEIFQRKGRITAGYNSGLLSVESNGGRMIPFSAYEPDAGTFRGDFYYNTTINTLFKKIVTSSNPKYGKLVAHWKRISSPT